MKISFIDKYTLPAHLCQALEGSVPSDQKKLLLALTHFLVFLTSCFVLYLLYFLRTARGSEKSKRMARKSYEMCKFPRLVIHNWGAAD